MTELFIHSSTIWSTTSYTHPAHHIQTVSYCTLYMALGWAIDDSLEYTFSCQHFGHVKHGDGGCKNEEKRTRFVNTLYFCMNRTNLCTLEAQLHTTWKCLFQHLVRWGGCECLLLIESQMPCIQPVPSQQFGSSPSLPDFLECGWDLVRQQRKC